MSTQETVRCFVEFKQMNKRKTNKQTRNQKAQMNTILILEEGGDVGIYQYQACYIFRVDTISEEISKRLIRNTLNHVHQQYSFMTFQLNRGDATVPSSSLAGATIRFLPLAMEDLCA